MEGDVMLPHANKQDLPSAHDSGVKGDKPVNEFLLPDVNSDEEHVNSDAGEGELGELESNGSDNDEELDEDADSSDIVEEDSREHEEEEIDEEVHLLDRFRPSHACGPFVCPQLASL